MIANTLYLIVVKNVDRSFASFMLILDLDG